MLSEKEIELLAKDKKPLLEKTSLSQTCLYWGLSGLYDRYFAQSITTAQASAEKKNLLRLYEEAILAEGARVAIYANYQENIKKSGSLLAEVEKAEKVEDIAEKACECISRMTGDKSFFTRQKKKIKAVKK